MNNGISTFKMVDKTGSSNRSSSIEPIVVAHNRMNLKYYANSAAKKNSSKPEVAVWPSKPEVLISATV